jgi:hypothetical protein
LIPLGNGWPNTFGMSKCYVTFGLGVVEKRADGGEKGDEWDIQGMNPPFLFPNNSPAKMAH